MTKLFKVHSLSFVKRELEEESRFQKNRIKFFTFLDKGKRRYGRLKKDTPEFPVINKTKNFSKTMPTSFPTYSSPFNESKKSSVEIGKMKYEKSHPVRISNPSFVNIKTQISRNSNRKIGKFLKSPNHFTRLNHVNKEDNIDYLKEKPTFTIEYKKNENVTRDTYYFNRFFSNENKVIPSRKEALKKIYKKSLSLPMIIDKNKAKAYSKYLPTNVMSFEAYAKRAPEKGFQKPTTGNHLSYWDRKEAKFKRFIGDKHYVPTFDRMFNHDKKALWDVGHAFTELKSINQKRLQNVGRKGKYKIRGYNKGWKKMKDRGITNVKRDFNSYLEYNPNVIKYKMKKKMNMPNYFLKVGRKTTVTNLVKQVDSLLKHVDKYGGKYKKRRKKKKKKNIIQKIDNSNFFKILEDDMI